MLLVVRCDEDWVCQADEDGAAAATSVCLEAFARLAGGGILVLVGQN